MIRSGFILSVCLVVSMPGSFSRARDAPPAQAGPAETQWPEAVAFISEDCSLKSNGLSIFRVGNTRAYYQFDLPMPSKIGRQLYLIKPARPGVEPRLLLDLGKGRVGSPSASFDGKTIYVSMAREGEFFYHIYGIPTDGNKPTRITDGPFHDLEPAELPDGRIVFSSTRIGTFEEYHSSPSRALFVMNADGSGIHPITFTSIFDNEPKVMADGSIVFIRSDNFLERAKVETRLHAVRPDGTGGRSIASADRGANYGARLRKFGFGSPAPLPDGRLAFLSSRGNLLITPSAPREQAHRLPGNLQGLAPLPDGRLLCTVKCTLEAKPAVEFVLKLAEETTQLDRVVIENYGQAEAKGNYYAKDFSIAMSSTTRDSKAFKTVCKGTLKAELGPQTFKIQPVRAKYVKLLITSGYRQDYIELGELAIHDAKGRNVAAAANGGKVLSCTSAYKSRGVWAPEYLIDGKKNGRGGSWCSEDFRRRKAGSNYNTIAILDPDRANQLTTVFQSRAGAIHSAVYVGPAPKQKTAITDTLKTKRTRAGVATGYFLCQSARITRKTAADWRRIRAVRVLGGKVSTLRSSNFEAVHQGLEAVEFGTVPLSPDGSFFVEVPADTPIAFQMLDGEGRSQLNEMSWIFVRPGETRSCIGCHESRGVAPSSVGKGVQAARARPVKLVGRGKPYRFRGQNPWVNGLMDMQFERIREIASIGQRGFGKDPGATGAAEWKAVASWLTSKDAGLRISACQRLGGTHERRFSGSLVRLLKDPDREVRIAAALALSACGSRPSLPHLLAALDDPDPVTAQAAALALENLTAHAPKFNPFDATEQRRLQTDQWRAWFTSLSWESHEKALIAHLTGSNRVLRHKAIVALGHIGGDNAKKALRQFLIAESKNNPYGQRGPGEGITFSADSRLNPRATQEAARALGHLRDANAIGPLKEILGRNLSSRKSNLFLAESCLEALAVIGDRQLEDYMIRTFGQLEEFHAYYNWYGGGHPYNEVSTLHFRMLDVLDRIGSTKTAALGPAIVRSLPIDVDRQLLFELDDYELMASRAVTRSGCEDKVVQTCLALLGDDDAVADKTIASSVSTLYRAFAGRPQLANRAAQILSIMCTDRKYEPRIRAVFNRYRAQKRGGLFRTRTIRSPVPDRPWVLFYMARLLGKLADSASSGCLIAALEKDPNEAALGRPAPDTVWVGMLQETNTPCYRAAAAYALGRIGRRSAAGVLMKTLRNMDNALDVRHASAVALKRIADESDIQAIAKIAADYPEVSVRRVLLSIEQEHVRREGGQAASGNRTLRTIEGVK